VRARILLLPALLSVLAHTLRVVVVKHTR